MVYFSETVCVLTCSSSLLPALEGARESAKGSIPYILLSRFPSAEPKLVLRDGVSTGDPGADSSSRNLWVFDREGGKRRVLDESITPPWYSLFNCGLFFIEDAVGGLFCGIRDREAPESCSLEPAGLLP